TAGMSYWGYSNLAWLAPDRRYACDRSPGGPSREVAAMTRAFHAHGIKVLVDVVFNHTAEGGGARLYSWRGLDDALYYELAADGTKFQDDTGVGANVAVTQPAVRELVVASLRHWHDDLGVDGFRFDLAPVIANSCARGCYQFDAADPNGLLQRIPRELPGAAL